MVPFFIKKLGDFFMLECLECGAEVKLPESAQVGEVFECSNCGTQLEIFSIDPPVIDLFEEEEK